MFQTGLGTDKDITKAVEFFIRAAENKNHRAELQLGRNFLLGVADIEPDREKGREWLSLSAEHGNGHAQKLLDNMEQYQNQILADTVFSLLVNLSRVIEEDYDRTGRIMHSHVDSKLRRIIQQKKKELGIKENQSPAQSY